MPPGLPRRASQMSSGHIPRASTCPSLGAGSPRAGQRPQLVALPTARWRPAAPAAANVLLPTHWSSRSLLLITLLLYTLAVLSVPVMWGSSGRFHRPGGKDLQAAAAAEGLLPAEHPDRQRGERQKQQQGPQIGQPSSLPAALRARRMALERPWAAGAAAELWPDAAAVSASALLLTAARPQIPRVEYREAGNVVELADALNISRWNELPLYRSYGEGLDEPAGQEVRTVGAGQQAAMTALLNAELLTRADSMGAGVHAAAPGGKSAGGSPLQHAAASFPVQCPQGETRLFIAIASRCCLEEVRGRKEKMTSRSKTG